MAFCSFGAFWISFYFLLHVTVGAIPKTEIFSALGLYLWAWGIFTAYMFIASLRTTGAVALVFLLLAITFIVLGIGNSALAGHATALTNGTIKLGGYVGHRDRDRRLVRVVRRRDQLDVRKDGAAGLPVDPLTDSPYRPAGVGYN